jgi:hypothetical protein
MNPMFVADPKIRKMLQLAGLRFVCSRAMWLHHEAKKIGEGLNIGAITPQEADLKIEELGIIDLVYPELAGFYENGDDAEINDDERPLYVDKVP